MPMPHAKVLSSGMVVFVPTPEEKEIQDLKESLQSELEEAKKMKEEMKKLLEDAKKGV